MTMKLVHFLILRRKKEKQRMISLKTGNLNDV